MTTALLTIAAICAALYLRLCTASPGPLRSAVKTASTALLALAVGLAGGPVALIAALALSSLGDLALSRSGDRAFLAGMAAFALAHLAYIAHFFRLGAEPALLADPLRAAGLMGLLGLVAVAGPRFLRGAGALAVPVAGYIAVIAAMGATALALPGLSLPLLGAALFIASDLVLGEQTFGTPRGPWADRALWALYWSAQAVFALSAFQNNVP